ILRPYLAKPELEYCFTTGTNSKRPYRKDSYCRAITRACERAGVERWTPRQLRHSRATLIRELYGVEAAQVILGHSSAKVTEIYAERDFKKAADIMKKIG
ncbi:MAG: tyrosine-type recombinase/integrase, partial [Rhodopirellula sp.]|nr:tyrosine-type recombinase/integrase [Rhodopirellula sp.]